ncbi:hypothetical protein ACFQE0_20870 [Methylobacterium komagatae]|uniref:Uncharacterized protein n=1 Tax=Methylobacterium komagatae TaxID=374425 RepID=A0ABW2BPN6_9HYPH
MLGFLKSLRRRSSAPDTTLPGFDRAYYLANNPDVKATGRDPQAHFLEYGWKEGRDPSWGFRLSRYLQANPDVRDAGVNPLVHFLEFGLAEGRDYGAPGAHGESAVVKTAVLAGVTPSSRPLLTTADESGPAIDRLWRRKGSLQRMAKTGVVLGYDPPAPLS